MAAGRPLKPVTPELEAFAALYLRTGNATRSVQECFPEGSPERRQPASRTVHRARRLGLLPSTPPLPGDHETRKQLQAARMADALAANVIPEPPAYIKDLLDLDKRVAIPSPPPPGPGIQRASFNEMGRAELLARLAHIGRASLAPFISMDFVPDSAEEQATELEAEEHEGVRGRWIYGLTMTSIGRAIRAGYGPWIRELKYDPQGRPCIKVYNAPDVMALFARITGMDKSTKDQKMTVEVLMKASSLSPEEKRQRAIEAISRQSSTEDEVEDAIIVPDGEPA